MTIIKATKKPVTIEAVQLTDDNVVECLEFIGAVKNDPLERRFHRTMNAIEFGGMMIHTLDGDMKAYFGDYIINGVDGEFYPCKPEIFEKTYDIH